MLVSKSHARTSPQNSLDSELNSIFDKFDKNKNGFIDYEEFAACLHLLRYNVNPVSIEEEFLKCDRNSDGKIDIEEFKFLLRSRLRKDFLKVHTKV